MKILSIILLVLVNDGWSKLFPISPFKDVLQTAMFPNERLSLDDCHLRYFKYGKQGLVAPAFGEPAYLTEFAHMAAIGWTQNDSSISWLCGGSLIWNNYVLTAAHCTFSNGTAPDVVRLGDINIFSDDDDQYAQQLKIIEIIKHPEYSSLASYHDIALLKLESNVTLHPTVVPACLWKDKEVRYPLLEATGWGDTGYAQDRTPVLLKVQLKPISNEQCNGLYSNANRRLSEGIKDHHICAGDERMDTCPGDSGGPLQIKLLHNGRVSPFLIGITSFGVACGSSIPGVYTRVSEYYEWIKETIKSQESNVFDWSVEPLTCALRYAYLRDYEDDVIISRSENFQSLDQTKAHMEYAEDELDHKVEIAWRNWKIRSDNCTGTLIADDTVLTLAECTSSHGIAATHIKYNFVGYLESDTVDIAEVFIKPGYTEYSLYNNIAVLKLKNRVKLSKHTRPACIWHSQSIPDPQVEVAGIGRIDINRFNRGVPFSESFWPQDTHLIPRASVNTEQNCSIPSEFLPRLTHGLSDEHLCVGNRIFLFPESCRLKYGAPVQRSMYRNGRYFNYAYGLNLFGRECGFGEAAVSTRLNAHIDWLKTVLLPNIRDADSSVQFINPDWKENDTCEYDYDEDVPGVCTHYSKCPKVWEDFKAKRRVNFCSAGSVLCCPTKFIQKQQPVDQLDILNTCKTDFAAQHPKMNDLEYSNYFPHIVTVQWNGTLPNQCYGSLISKRTVVTAASCVSMKSTGPNSVKLADNKTIPVGKTTVHPNYRSSDKLDNIALLELTADITPNSAVFPACIWMNLTHTPLNLILIREENGTSTAERVVPMYTTDCQRDYHSRLNDDHLCIDELNLEATNTCYRAGDQLVWNSPDDARLDQDTTGSPHVVGFYSYGENCEETIPGVFTRIASYVDWIRQNM